MNDYVRFERADSVKWEALKAKVRIHRLAEEGKAGILLDAYEFYSQTWPHLAGIIEMVAKEGADMTAQKFAKSLQEEMGK